MKMNLLTNVMNKMPLKIRNKSDGILFVAGVAGFVGTVVLACKASRKIDDILDEHKEAIEEVEATAAKAEDYEMEEQYDEKAAKRQVYIHTALSIGKLYAPVVGMGIISVSCFGGSRKILKDRVVNVTAGYMTLKAGFDNYRKRVIEELGEEADRRFKYGAHEEEVEYVEVDENGKEKKKKEKVQVVTSAGMSDYDRIFEEVSCKWTWSDKPGDNLDRIKLAQQYFNDLVESRGYVFLNEVYRELGFEETKAGNIVGISKYSTTGDKKWTFYDRIEERALKERSRVDQMFLNKVEPNVLLEFNVSPIIDEAFDLEI